MMSDRDNFFKRVKRVSEERKKQPNHSFGMKDVMRKLIGLGVLKEIGITTTQFYKIINLIHEELCNELLKGKCIKLPYNMGSIELRKNDTSPKIIDGKLKTVSTVDWNKTLNLWYDDEEARLNKTLIKVESKEIFRFYYHKYNYTNAIFYVFRPNRTLKLRLKKLINNNNIDALTK